MPSNLYQICATGVICKTVQNAHGSDCDVVFAPIFRRRGMDRSWAGNVQDCHHLWQAFTRAKRRLYIPIEELEAYDGQHNSRLKQNARMKRLARAAHDTLQATGCERTKIVPWSMAAVPYGCTHWTIPLLLSPMFLETMSELGRSSGNDNPAFVEPGMTFHNAKKIGQERRSVAVERLLSEVRRYFQYMGNYWPVEDQVPTPSRKYDPQASASSLPAWQTLFPTYNVRGKQEAHISPAVKEKARGAWEQIMTIDTVAPEPSEPPRQRCYSAARKVLTGEADLDNLEVEVEDARHSQELLENWHIPGMTIHITTNKCMVMVPILSAEIALYSEKELDVAMAVITRLALKYFMATEQFKDMKDTDVQVDCCIEHHKNDEVELGGYRFMLPECSTDRPAFVIRGTYPDQTVVRLLYLYPAMGLNMQHDAQQMLLGRTGLPVMAACLLKACINLMIHTSYTVRPVGCTESTAKTATDAWTLLVQQLDLPDSTRCAIPDLPAEVVCEAQRADLIEDCERILHRLLPEDLMDLLQLPIFA